MALPLLPLIGLAGKLFDKVIPDKGKKQEMLAELYRMEAAGELKEIEGAAAIIQAEANSEHWLTANWRPLTMLTFVVIIANNYILYPYLSLFWIDAPNLELPPDMWALLKIGLGGYTVGRSGEKIAKALANKE